VWFLVGMGHGLTLLSAFALIHHMTNVENRAAVVSYLFIAYLAPLYRSLAQAFYLIISV
jgi:hypothetical protein